MKISDPAAVARCYRALVDRSPEHVGAFYAAVKTTGIFCISTCRARKPKQANVDFYPDMQEPIALGFRPCKVCRPTESSPDMPPQVERAIALVRAHPAHRVPDKELRALGLSPELIRRWFLKHHGHSFQAYQRMLRVNAAMRDMKEGRSTIDAALGSGYESLSGFAYTVKKMTGQTPSKAVQPLVMQRFSTPLGAMFVCAGDKGVCLLEFADRPILDRELRQLERHYGSTILAGENAHTREAAAQMLEYMEGKRSAFSVPLDIPGTAFQLRVWQALRDLPHGATTHYAALAESIGAPSATRAAAAANGANRIAIIIPCHRVIGKNGSLTGYGGGLARKQWLLAHEQANQN